MNIQAKIAKMESARGRNHPLMMFQGWLNKYLPAYKNLKLIQVGGTNGKGSTCQWLNLLLQEEGYRVGLFTSPHLMAHQERIQVDSISISEKDWERLYDQYVSFFEQEQLTMFEMDLFMALAYFIEQKIDYGVIEVGMGGRYDATSALDYIATLITNVGKDHMEYLGTSLDQIAKEKAGIFKENTLAIAYDTTCFAIMEEEAFKARTSLLVADYDLSAYQLHHLPKYQRENLILALSCLEQLKLLKSSAIQKTIDTFIWAGRFQVLREKPLILVDGAHNVPGIEAFVKAMQDFQGTIYFSALKEKEVDAMIELLLSLKQRLVLVEFETDRLAAIESLAQRFDLEKLGFKAFLSQLKISSFDQAVCGSLYFVGEVLKNREALF